MNTTTETMWANNKGFRMEDFTKPQPTPPATATKPYGHDRIGKYNARIVHADFRGIDVSVDITTPDFDTEAEARAYALNLARQTPRANRIVISRIERDSFSRGLYGEFIDQIDSTDEAWNELDETTPNSAEEDEATTPAVSRRTRRATNRTRRATLKARTRQTRAAAKIQRTGVGTLTQHCIAAGLGIREARTVASSLRKNAAKAGAQGTAGVSYTKGRARTCTRYTPAEVAAIALVYRPRKPAYKACAARLALAA